MKPLDQETLFKLVSTLTRKGFYILTAHAEQRMNERNFTRNDIENILTNPHELIGQPRFDNKFNTYKYRIAGGETQRSVVVGIDFDNLLIVVTVI